MRKLEPATWQAFRILAIIGIVLCPIVGGTLLMLAAGQLGTRGDNVGGLIFFGVSFLLATVICIVRLRTLNRNRPGNNSYSET